MELFRLHVADDGLAHLSGHGSAIKVRRDIHGGHQQAAAQHLRLDHHAQLTAHVPRVDGLDGRLVVGWQLGEVHDLCAVEQLPPVEVGPVVGGKLAEQRMGGVDMGAGGVGRTHLEPAGVPEHRQVLLLDVVAIAHLAGGCDEHLTPLAQRGDGLGVERVGEVDVAGRRHGCLVGVDPIVVGVGVGAVAVAEGEREGVLTGRGGVGEERHSRHLKALARGKVGGEHRAVGGCVRYSVGQACLVERLAAQGVIDVDGHLGLLAGGEHKLRELSHHHHVVAKLAPLGAVDIPFLAEEHIERTHQRGALAAIVVESQQQEASVVLGAQVALNLILIAKGLQLAAGEEELARHRLHAVVLEQVGEDVEVVGFVDARVLVALAQVGESAPLALLVGDDGRVVGLVALVVAWVEQLIVVVVDALGCASVPIEAACARRGTAIRHPRPIRHPR